MNNVIKWVDQPRQKPDDLKSGDGGGTFGGMEARVKALEDRFEKMDSKLDTILLDLASMKSSLATKDDVFKIAERVSRLEGSALTFWQFLIVMGTLLAIVLRWPELFKMAAGQ